MNVVILELCKELYELSGWKDTDVWYIEVDKDFSVSAHSGEDGYYLMKGISLSSEQYEQDQYGLYPAYDLGYLLRKLPRYIRGNRTGYLDLHPQPGDTEWEACYHHDYTYGIADTPEDAACKLCIELFEQGILRKETA